MKHQRLTPTMSSRRAMVLDFVTAWIGSHNGLSPSLGEIAQGCGPISKQEVHRHLDALVEAELVIRTDAPSRNLTLPSERERAIRIIRATGGWVDNDFLTGAVAPLTFSQLPMMPSSGQIAAGDGGSGGGGTGAERNGPEGPAGDRGAVSARRPRRSARGAGAQSRAA